MSALVRITTGIMPQHSRVGVSRAMAQFGEVIHCHKPPYSGIPGEDFVNVRFATQTGADAAYEALKNGSVFIDGFPVGVGAAPKPLGSDAQFAIANGQRAPPRERRARSPSPPRPYSRGVGRDPGDDDDRRGGRDDRRGGRSRRSPPQQANFPSRNDPKSPSPRRYAREMHMGGRRERSRSNNPRPRAIDRVRSFEPQPQLGYQPPSMAIEYQPPARRERTPSPDPPGPARSSALVKNPFFRPVGRQDDN